MSLRIVEECEGYVLVCRGERFALMERRAGLFYNLHGGAREGVPGTAGALCDLLDEHDWVEERAAREAMAAAVRRRTDMAERML
jgi:hypothetical protein